MLGSKTTNFFLGPNITFLTLFTLVYVPHSSFHPWILKKFCFGRILYCDFRERDSEIGTLRNFSLVTARGRESRDSLFGSKQCNLCLQQHTVSVSLSGFLKRSDKILIRYWLHLSSEWVWGQNRGFGKCTEKWFWLGNRCNPTLDWDLNLDLHLLPTLPPNEVLNKRWSCCNQTLIVAFSFWYTTLQLIKI